jgi:hypothetical protein
MIVRDEKEWLTSESGHFYYKDGTPCYTVLDKKGNERGTTLRDARKLDLLPSVSTIMKCASAPGLDVWKMKQMMLSALTLPRIDGEPEDEYIARIVRDSKETGRKAADRGTLIHGALEAWYANNKFDSTLGEYIIGTHNKVLEVFGEQIWCAEKSFAHESGYGGKVDLHSCHVVIDFKTKEFTRDNLPKPYDENVIQLAAYRRGLGYPNARCANVFVSVLEPGLVHIVEHSEDDLIRGLSMFDYLLGYWKFKSKYHP